MSKVLNVKLKEGSEGPALAKLIYLDESTDSHIAVVDHLQNFGYPVGNILANGISFIISQYGDMATCLFHYYIGVTVTDGDQRIVQISADCVERFYDVVEDQVSTEQKLWKFLDSFHYAYRTSSMSNSFCIQNTGVDAAYVIRDVAIAFGCKAYVSVLGEVNIDLGEGTGFSVKPGAFMTVAPSGMVGATTSPPSMIDYDLQPVGKEAPDKHYVVYDGTAACRESITVQLCNPGVKFLLQQGKAVLNIIGNHHDIEIGDYVVATDLGKKSVSVCLMKEQAFSALHKSVSKENEMGNKKKEKKQKTLHNSTVSGARDNVSDLQVFGDGDTFKLICKASSAQEGWMKSTKAMEIPGVGCVVQVTTQQGKRVAEALTFVPNCRIDLIGGDKKNGRRLVQLNAPRDTFHQFGDESVQDSLPDKAVEEFLASPRAQQGVLFERTQEHVICARQIAHYHNMIRFDGSAECADIIIEWVNNNTDLSRVIYDVDRAAGSITMDWDNGYPATPIHVGDYVVDKGNGRFHVLGGKGIEGEYSFGQSNGIDSDEVAEVATMVDDGPMYFINKEGESVTAYAYDGSPASAGVIVAAAARIALDHETVTYGREGLGVLSNRPDELDFFIAEGEVVVFDAHCVRAGSRQWLALNYSPIAS